MGCVLLLYCCVKRVVLTRVLLLQVPFILKAGKALDERKGEIRIQFKDAPAASFMFERCEHDAAQGGCGGLASHLPRNELVMKLQPEEVVYLKINVKTPGLVFDSTQSELDLSYNRRLYFFTEYPFSVSLSLIATRQVQGHLQSGCVHSSYPRGAAREPVGLRPFR